jgi:hypothetical protein
MGRRVVESSEISGKFIGPAVAMDPQSVRRTPEAQAAIAQGALDGETDWRFRTHDTVGYVRQLGEKHPDKPGDIEDWLNHRFVNEFQAEAYDAARQD